MNNTTTLLFCATFILCITFSVGELMKIGDGNIVFADGITCVVTKNEDSIGGNVYQCTVKNEGSGSQTTSYIDEKGLFSSIVEYLEMNIMDYFIYFWRYFYQQ